MNQTSSNNQAKGEKGIMNSQYQYEILFAHFRRITQFGVNVQDLLD